MRRNINVFIRCLNTFSDGEEVTSAGVRGTGKTVPDTGADNQKVHCSDCIQTV